jgi:hypothetical protein
MTGMAEQEVFRRTRTLASLGLLGVDPMSVFPDIAGFAAANNCNQDVPLLPW